MTAKPNTDLMVECRAGNTVIWKNGNGQKSLGGIIENLRQKGIKDPLAKGIWSSMPTKFSNLNNTLED